MASTCRGSSVEKKLPSAGAESFRSRRTPFKSPGPNALEHAHGVCAAAGTSHNTEEEYICILRKGYRMRYGRAQ